VEKKDENGAFRDQPSESEDNSLELVLLPTEAIEHSPTSRLFTVPFAGKDGKTLNAAFGSVSGNEGDDKSKTAEQRSTYAMRSRHRQEFKEKCDVVQKVTATIFILYISLIIAVTLTWIALYIWTNVP
jgi:hypothetical protein